MHENWSDGLRLEIMNYILNVINIYILILILSKPTTTPPNSDNCNCNNPSECPINKNCKSKNVIYKAQVTSPDDGVTKEYIGMTATTFKERYANHKKSFKFHRYKNDTELSKYIWELKSNDMQRLHPKMVNSEAGRRILIRCKAL